MLNSNTVKGWGMHFNSNTSSLFSICLEETKQETEQVYRR